MVSNITAANIQLDDAPYMPNGSTMVLMVTKNKAPLPFACLFFSPFPPFDPPSRYALGPGVLTIIN